MTSEHCNNCRYRTLDIEEIPPLPRAPPSLFELSISNDIPSPTDLVSFSTGYSDICAALSATEVQIERFTASLGQWSIRKLILKARVSEYKSVLHPIRRLSDDVLLYIFRICIDGDLSEELIDDGHYPGSLDTRMAPWILTQICQRWRVLVTSSPQFWTSIYINWRYDKAHVPKYHPSLERLLALQLQRCLDQPISIRYRGARAHTSRDIRYATNERLLMVLCSRSMYWSRASFEFIDKETINPLTCYQGLLPNLAELQLRCPFSHEYDEEALSIFGDTPHLRKLRIIGNLHYLLKAPIPFQQITEFVSRNDDEKYWNLRKQEQYFSTLPRLRNVQMLDLQCSRGDNGRLPELPRESLILSGLHTLTLQSEELDLPAVYQLLKWLTLPALQTLRLPGGFASAGYLSKFLGRSQCVLHELVLTDARIGLDVLVQLLCKDALRNLETFTLGVHEEEMRVSGSHNVFRKFTILPNETEKDVMLPKLETFRMRGIDGLTQPLCDMIMSRTVHLPSGVSALKYFAVCGMPAADFQKLKEGFYGSGIALMN
ncbi:hypothetical protein VNI00_006812 [Paramarasmius palmivorus]|uniref:F-box domain-containing protein n=1 Tax=Paramarasmius palmivorus TaxID=297713 RepID=A0AAW0D854_9AGAR